MSTNRDMSKHLRRGTTSCYELSIDVLRATNLRAADVGGTSDPYCKLLFGAERVGKTKAINYTLEPVWNEHFVLTIPSQLSAVGPLSFLTMEIWDKDSLSADDLLGSCRVYLPRDVQPHESWYQLTRPSGGEELNGRVLIRCEWNGMVPPMEVDSIELMRDACPPTHPAHAALYCDVGPVTIPPLNEAVLATVEEIALYPPYDGTMFITDCRVVFVPYIANETRINDPEDYRHVAVEITFPSIFNIRTEEDGAKSSLTFVLKSNRVYKFSLVTIGGSSEGNSARNSNRSSGSGSERQKRSGGNSRSTLNGLRDLGGMIGGRKGSVSSASSRSSGWGVMERMASEIQWRCEEGCLAFSLCAPHIDAHRGLGGHDHLVQRFENTTATGNNNLGRETKSMTQLSSIIEHNSNSSINDEYDDNTNSTFTSTSSPASISATAADTSVATAVASVSSVFSVSSLETNSYQRQDPQPHIATSHNTRRERALSIHGMPDIEMARISASAYFYDEMQRLYLGGASSRWTYVENNWTYELCPTYSRHVVIPSIFPLTKLHNAASYRSKMRLPALTWIHPENGACLCRCAQPRSGFTQMASMPEDDEMLLAIRSTAKTLRRPEPVLHIFDARPKLNANANAIAGKGFENVSRLGGDSVAKIMFCGIANIHVMRGSLHAFMKACESSLQTGRRLRLGSSSENQSFHEKVGGSKWLEHVALLLRSSAAIADTLHIGQPCIVHCSDGWDRTSQLSALSQMMLDPYYLTINGFRALVEKDWCGFGHKFRDRIGVYASDGSAQNERSPIFIQFLDAVYQMYYQRPELFEFDEALLLFLGDATYSGLYGTFLSNSEKERVDFCYASDTISCWEYVDVHRAEFVNPLYLKMNNMQNQMRHNSGEVKPATNNTHVDVGMNEEVEVKVEVDDEGDVVANGLTPTKQRTKNAAIVRCSANRLKIDGNSSSMVVWTSYYMRRSVHRVTPLMQMKRRLQQLEQAVASNVSAIDNRNSENAPSDSSNNTSNEATSKATTNCGGMPTSEVQHHLLLVQQRRSWGVNHGNNNGNSPKKRVSLFDASVLDSSSSFLGNTNDALVLRETSTYECSVKKVSIIRDSKGGRFGAYLVRVSQSKPTVATCAFHRRFSDFVWLESQFRKCGLEKQFNWSKLPSKDLFRWYGHEYLEERRQKLDDWVQQLSLISEKIPRMRKVICVFLDSRLPAGIK
jgi:hypothetical protein